VYAVERSFLYFPERVLATTPAELGLTAEEVWLQTADGVRLYGYWLPGRGQRLVVWFHGNAGNISHRLPHARLLLDRFGLDQLLVDYRGYGRSHGRPSETGLYRDGLAVYAAALRRGYRPEQIVLFGRSLGAAVAIEVARQQPAGAVILETAFLSIPSLARALYPWVPPVLVRSRFDNAAKIRQVLAPKLIVHGDRDEVVPLAHGQRLFDLAPEPKRFGLIQGAGHNDLVLVGGEPYLHAWNTFLEDTAPPASD
jgi:fermentation-respiration switch protein FrsA (DUF1100 family)